MALQDCSGTFRIFFLFYYDFTSKATIPLNSVAVTQALRHIGLCQHLISVRIPGKQVGFVHSLRCSTLELKLRV